MPIYLVYDFTYCDCENGTMEDVDFIGAFDSIYEAQEAANNYLNKITQNDSLFVKANIDFSTNPFASGYSCIELYRDKNEDEQSFVVCSICLVEVELNLKKKGLKNHE